MLCLQEFPANSVPSKGVPQQQPGGSCASSQTGRKLHHTSRISNEADAQYPHSLSRCAGVLQGEASDVLGVCIMSLYINSLVFLMPSPIWGFEKIEYVLLMKIGFQNSLLPCYIFNLREKFSSEPGFEPRSQALSSSALSTVPPRRITG